MIAKKINDHQFAALLPYAHNCCYGLIIAQDSDFFAGCSPIDSVSRVMKLSDYDAATNSKFTAYTCSLIFIGCIVCIQ